MALVDLLAGGAMQFARRLIDLGVIAPNVIRSVLQEYAGEPYRSARALVSRAFQARRAANEALGSDFILVKDVPLWEKPASTPFRGIGRGRFEAKVSVLMPGHGRRKDRWRRFWVNFDRGLTVEDVKAKAAAGVNAMAPFYPKTGAMDIFRQVTADDVDIVEIFRRN